MDISKIVDTYELYRNQCLYQCQKRYQHNTIVIPGNTYKENKAINDRRVEICTSTCINMALGV
jgi:hypothetical protein